MISSNNTHMTTFSTTTDQSDEGHQELQELITEWQGMIFEESATLSLAKDVRSSDIKKQLYGTIGLRKILSIENPPIQKVLNSRVVPALIQLVQTSSESTIQLEAARCLTNLSSGTTEQAQALVDQGIIPGLISALNSSNEDVIGQGLWGVGYIAGDSAYFNHLMIQHGAVESIIKVLENTKSLYMKRQAAWPLSNLCREEPFLPYEAIARAIPVFSHLMKNEDDPDVLIDITSCLFCFSSINQGIDAILSFDMSSRLVGLLNHTHIPLLTICIKIIGNIVSGTNEQIARILKEKDLLPSLLKLTEHKKDVIRRETFRILTNMAVGSPVQFESVIGYPNFVERIIQVAKNDSSEISLQAIFILFNSKETCTPAQIIRMLNNGIFSCFIELLSSPDDEILKVALRGLRNCLKWAKEFNLNAENGMNKFVAQLQSEGGLEKLENLQNHPNGEIYEAAMRIQEGNYDANL